MQQPMLYISSSEASVCTERCRIMKTGNKQVHRDILLQQPTLYISSREAAVCTESYRSMKARNTQPYSAIIAYAVHFL